MWNVQIRAIACEVEFIKLTPDLLLQMEESWFAPSLGSSVLVFFFLSFDTLHENNLLLTEIRWNILIQQ